MSFEVYASEVDVAIVAGPRLNLWPTIGVRAISNDCTEMGLKVGWFGGDTHYCRGVLPLPTSGGLIVAEDPQGRIHRVKARAVVAIRPQLILPDPFEGWRAEALVPFPTAVRLFNESRVTWQPGTVILGTGNRAFRFGSELLESGKSNEVLCVETFGQWGEKNYRGWEVERRRFEVLGGKVVQATPLSLTKKDTLLWEFKLRDDIGVRLLDVTRVVTVGPYRDMPVFREHPPGSFLFELQQISEKYVELEPDGWAMEREAGRVLATRIIKRLSEKKRSSGGSRRRGTERRIKRLETHRREPFEFKYQGKWLSTKTAQAVRDFAGTPDDEVQKEFVASIECFEEIPCNVCQTTCPEDAISIDRSAENPKFLLQDKCTGCGVCLKTCPSRVPVLIRQKEQRSTSGMVFFWKGQGKFRKGELARLVNRKGQELGSGRVSKVYSFEVEIEVEDLNSMYVQVDVPQHLIWEARGIRKPLAKAIDEKIEETIDPKAKEIVEIYIDGKKRLVRDKVPLSLVLYENGLSRSEDALFCPDGSCQLCALEVDGAKTLACQTKVRKGMAIKLRQTKIQLPIQKASVEGSAQSSLCPCLGISIEDVINRVKNGNFNTVEAILAVTHVGEGKCRGQFCLTAFRRLLVDMGYDASGWSDWRFPFAEWVVRWGA